MVAAQVEVLQFQVLVANSSPAREFRVRFKRRAEDIEVGTRVVLQWRESPQEYQGNPIQREQRYSYIVEQTGASQGLPSPAERLLSSRTPFTRPLGRHMPDIVPKHILDTY